MLSATGIPVADWVGDCFGIALAITDRGLVDGRPTLGLYSGPVHPACPFRVPASPLAMTWGIETVLGEWHPGGGCFDEGHIRLADGRVLDAHRWVYEMVPPYIYVGPGDEYRSDEDEDPELRWYIDHLADLLSSGVRQPYDGSLRFCEHDTPQRKVAQLYLRKALQDPWFRPLFDLIEAQRRSAA